MPEVSSYSTNTDPDGEFLLFGVDPSNTGQGPGGTVENVPLSTVLAKATGPITTEGDLMVGGTGGTPQRLAAGTANYVLTSNGPGAVPSYQESSGGGGGGSGDVPTANVIWMDNLGADHTGTDSVTTLFNDQLAGQDGAACVFIFGVGTYLFETAPDSLGPDQSVAGMGSRVTQFTWSGSGPLFTATTAAVADVWDGSLNAGSFSGFGITGPYGDTATSSGIKYGALQGIRIDDVGFYGLPGGAILAYVVTVGVDWSEEAQITRLDISECGAQSGFVFSFNGTSFDYSRLDALVVVEANIDIVALNGAEMQGLELHLRGNLHGGTSNTGAIISMDRASSSTASLIGGGSFLVSMEADDSSAGGSGDVGHYNLVMNSSSPASQFQATGTFFAYPEGSCVPQGWANGNNLPCGFSGWANAIDGTAAADGDALVAMGGTVHVVEGSTTTTLADLGGYVYPEFGDVWIIQTVTAANTIEFDTSMNSWGRSMKLLLVGPTSGTAGIITFTNQGGGTILVPSTAITAPATGKATLVGIEWFGTANNFGVATQLGTGYTIPA